MQYQLLGRSGMRVAEVALGTMTFGEDWGWGASKEESRKIFDAYVEAGGNFIDTAINYTNGTSESFVGEFIRDAKIREQLVVATKYSLTTNPNDPNAGGNHRKNMMQSVEKSLKKLGTDYIDLYWLHIWDGTTSVEEVMRGLDDLVQAGKVLYVGISDTPAWVVSRANMLAELRGWSPFVALQLTYSLLNRAIEREYVPMAHDLDLAITSWGALSSGLLARTADASASAVRTANATPDTRQNAVITAVQEIAAETDHSPAQVAINWVRQQRGLIPIIGARTLSQFQDNMGSLDFRLSPEQIERLNSVSHIELGFPHDMMHSDMAKGLLFGNMASKIYNHRAG